MALTLPGPQVPFTASSTGPAAVVPTAAPLAPPLDFAFCGAPPRSYCRRLGCTFFPRYRCRLGCILLKMAVSLLLIGLVGSVEAAPMVEKIEERAELNQVREGSHLHDFTCAIASACLVSQTLPDSIS